MSYYDTNTEIANTFNVSKTTVTRWLESATDGKNNLQIDKRDKKVYVLKNEHNYAEMKKLKEEGMKYKGSTNYVEVSPKPEFYEIFSTREQIEIINLLNTKKTIPLKFSYFGKGADMWNEFYLNSLKHGIYDEITFTDQLINQVTDFLMSRVKNYSKVNIIDIGTGNGYPLKNLIEKMISNKIMGKYIAVDISEAMLEIAGKNINTWFDKKVVFVKYKRDIENDILSDILFENKDKDTINFIFMLGGLMGNIENYTRVLENISYSLGEYDLFTQISLINTENRKTDFSSLSNKNLTHFLTPKLLNIDIDKCDFSGRYDEKNSSRIGFFTPDRDYKINFVVNGVHAEVFLNRDQEVKIWYHSMVVKDDLFAKLTKVKLELIHANLTHKLSHLITVCQAANQ
jgi:SAM-dependent methyltransferase